MDIKWNINYQDVVDSTNDLVYQTISNDSSISEGFALRTGFQNKGKGQRGNHWESEKDQNLLLSIMLKPGLPVTRQFLLSQVVSLAVAEYLINHDLDNVKIKWPNDIYVGDKKIAGILIQNILNGRSIKNSIVGIGININQKTFFSDAPNPISLASIKGQDFDLDQECLLLLDVIAKNYQELFRVRKAKPQNMYRFLLYRLNQKASFMDNNEQVIEGIIRGVDDVGNLSIERLHGIEHFGFKEIKYII